MSHFTASVVDYRPQRTDAAVSWAITAWYKSGALPAAASAHIDVIPRRSVERSTGRSPRKECSV